MVCSGKAAIRKDLGLLNCSDLMTKHVDYETLMRMCELLQIRPIAAQGKTLAAVVVDTGYLKVIDEVAVSNKKVRSAQLKDRPWPRPRHTATR